MPVNNIKSTTRARREVAKKRECIDAAEGKRGTIRPREIDARQAKITKKKEKKKKKKSRSIDAILTDEAHTFIKDLEYDFQPNHNRYYNSLNR